MQVLKFLPARSARAIIFSILLGGLLPLLPWGVLFLIHMLEGNPDGAAGWTALGVVSVPFGALGGLITSCLCLRRRPWLGFFLGLTLPWAAFLLFFFERDAPGFALFNGIGLFMSAAAARWRCGTRMLSQGASMTIGAT